MTEKSSGSMFDMFQKFGESLKLPTPDVENVVNYHRKNIQAFQDSMTAASAGTKSVMEKQRQQLEEGLAEISKYVETMSATRQPTEMMSNNMDFARKSFEKTIKNTTELSEIMRDASSESFEILRKRMQESMEEIRDAMPGKK